MSNYTDHILDVVVLGAGGAGLRAALGCSEQGLKQLALVKFTNTEAIPLLHKEALVQHLEIWERIAGNGTCLILSKV